MIERSPFGSTGHASSRVIFGAAALSRVDQDQADALLPVLLEAGINHIDTASSYGESELRLAPWLVGHRSEFFLATKTVERSGNEARASLERSLERLGVDHVDLIQLHNLVEPDEWEIAHGRGGAVEALAQAQDEGLVRFIGITGHGTRIPRMHLASLERFPFDSVLMPFNFALMSNPDYRSAVEELLAACGERGVAVQTIKSIARRRWTEKHATRPRSWYEPLQDEDALNRAVRYVLSRPHLFLNSSSEFSLLPATIRAAQSPTVTPSDDELLADAERLDITALFDGRSLERI